MTIQAMKAVVVGLGVLIVAGVVVLAVAVADRLAAMRAAPDERPAAVELAVPAGSTVVETIADGDRLVLRLDTPVGPRLVVVNLRDGAVEATVTLVPAP